MGIKGKNDRMVVLACEECKERNYTTTKNKKNIKERMELSKYCPKCQKHTLHKEEKIEYDIENSSRFAFLKYSIDVDQ